MPTIFTRFVTLFRSPTPDLETHSLWVGPYLVEGNDRIASVYHRDQDSIPVLVEDNRNTGFEVEPSAFLRALGHARSLDGATR